MKIGMTNFKGAIPGVHPRLLPDDHASIASNVRLDDGTLTPIRDARRVHDFEAPVVSFIRRPDGAFLGFDAVVDSAPGAVDAARVYVTGAGVPRIWLPGGANVPLALPGPQAAPTATVTSGTVDPDLIVDSVYAYTFVTSLGEESIPSPPSNIVSWSPGVTITVSGLPTVAPIPGRLLTGMRVYRSVTDALGDTRYFFVAEIGFQPTYVNVTSADDTISGTAEEIRSLDYDTPPDDMQGIISLPNGGMAAFSGQELLFCEPYIHHAWPRKYRLRTEARIVGLGAFGSSVVILTEGTPYVAQGTTPETMVMERIELDLPCVSARSIADMGYSVIYASTDGLVQVSQQGAQVISSQMFTREVWAKMRPETFIASRMRGRYVFSYHPEPANGQDESGVLRRLGIVDTSGAQPFYITDDSEFGHLFYDRKDGALFGLFREDGVVRWDDLTRQRKRMVWRSKDIFLPTPTNFGVVRVDGDDDGASDVICRVYAGRNKRLVRETYGVNRPERLPSGFSEDVWCVEIEGTMTVTAIFVAHSPSELAG